MDIATDMKPEVLATEVLPGIAGQIAVTAQVRYPGEEPSEVAFTGSTYGGPIVMVSGGFQVFVDRDVAQRCGARLSAEWVAAFFA